ncbi:hypothetical protein Tco_1150933 [Tanacetum coccineum]
MPIELGTFDVIIGMDWLVERDAVIVCGKKEVHVPYKNKTLVVKSDSGASRLKVISCIKARKYIERGSQLFLAQVTEKEPSKKQLQDVPVIRNFPEVFPDDLPDGKFAFTSLLSHMKQVEKWGTTGLLLEQMSKIRRGPFCNNYMKHVVDGRRIYLEGIELAWEQLGSGRSQQIQLSQRRAQTLSNNPSTRD